MYPLRDVRESRLNYIELQRDKVNILFEASAVKYVLQYLKTTESYNWRSVKYINQGRYAIVSGQALKPNIAILFKKNWFMSFGTMNFTTPEGKVETGIGDTINVDDLRNFISHNVRTVYTLHPSGAIYSIDLFDFLNNSYGWKNKEGKDVRSISIHKYRRENNATI